MKKKSIVFSEDYAKILRTAWKKGDLVTSEDIASILYCGGKRIPKEERSSVIRNAVMTLTRMKNDGLIIGINKDEKKRMRTFQVISKAELRTKISKELKELFGEDFLDSH